MQDSLFIVLTNISYFVIIVSFKGVKRENMKPTIDVWASICAMLVATKCLSPVAENFKEK